MKKNCETRVEETLMNNQLQKYFPYILILLTVVIGGFLLMRKGFVSLPSLSKKNSIVSLGNSSVVKLLFSGEEYKLFYSEMNPNLLVDIAKFDKSEQWQGAGSIEEVILGEPVLSMIDRNRQKAIAYMLINLKLSEVDDIKFSINLKSDPDNIESINLVLGNKDLNSFYRFALTNLKEGVNYFSIPKYRFFLAEGEEAKATPTAVKTSFSWDKIEKVQLELVSRPSAKASIEVKWIRAEKDEVFKPDWNWSGGDHFLNMIHYPDDKLTLMVQQVGGAVATLRKLGSVENFTYTVKIIPLVKGPIGIFFRGDYKTGYGYYLTVGGLATSEWSITKFGLSQNQPLTSLLVNGQIANFEFTNDQPFWLKVSARGNTITGYFSLEGKEFTKLGEIADNEFGSGGIGINVVNGSAGLFDEFYLTKK